jgi:5-methylcytosine-specific restriction enzyme A
MAAVARLKNVGSRLPGIVTTRLQTQQVSADQSWRQGKTTSERGYGWRWQKARDAYLLEYPLCVYCARNGYITKATVVDHIVQHKGNQSLFWAVNNWQPLCKTCHDSIKKAEENRLNKY